MAPGTPLPKSELLFFASLLLGELSIAVMAKAMHMKGDRTFVAFLPSNPGMVFLVAIAVFLVVGAVLIWQYLANRRAPSRQFRLIVMMNLVTVLLILVTGEIAIRIVTRSSPEGEKFGSVVLKAKNWEMVALRYRQIIEKASGQLSPYIIYDDLMGWTVGPKRRSAEGLYWSSSEGIRAPREGVSFAKARRKTEIALVGDSYTFGEEVRYEDTWGSLLDKALGPEFQVLNFGVPGYGVDQAYLRYEKDVRQWKPDVVIFGFISHDAFRTMVVYPFLNFPDWDHPFSKPRLILHEGDLVRMNVPPLAPDAIFSRGSIHELPFLKYDIGYRQSDWQRSFYHLSYLARLFVSWYPRWPAVTPDLSEEALVSLNASILKAFVQSVAQTGTIPLVVYFPGKQEFEKPSSSPGGRRARRVLQEAGIAYTDPTSCLLGVNPADRFAPGSHYTPEGNAAVAKCLLNVVRQALAQAS